MKKWKLTVVKFILIVLTLFVMIFILQMSAMDAENSSKLSSSVGYTVGEVVVEGFNELPPLEQEQYVDSIEHPLRKLAHYAEFTALGILLMLDFMVLFGLNGIKRFIFSLLTGLIYAATDEIHQLVVSGRSCELRDVLIDVGGVLSGCILAGVIIYIVHIKFDLHRSRIV